MALKNNLDISTLNYKKRMIKIDVSAISNTILKLASDVKYSIISATTTQDELKAFKTILEESTKAYELLKDLRQFESILQQNKEEPQEFKVKTIRVIEGKK